MPAVDVKQVVPLVNVHRMSTKVHVLWSILVVRTCIWCGNKHERDRQASSSENDGDLDAEGLKT